MTADPISTNDTAVACTILLWATWRARAGSLSVHLLSAGILIWLTYGYAHLSFGTPFNAMFLVYVAVLTLAGFAMLDGLLRVDVAAASPAFAHLHVVPPLGSWRSPASASRSGCWLTPDAN